MVLLALAAALVVWVAAIFQRVRRRRLGLAPPPEAPEPQGSRAGWALAHALTLLASWPLLAALPVFVRRDSILPGDATAFARVAATLAEEGMPHGSIDVYAGGFPGAMHYQPFSVALLAAAIRAGLHPTTATQLVGVGSLLALPQALLVALRWAGVRPVAALAGAVALSLVSPERPLIGGWDVHVAQGVVAQVVSMPILVLAAGAVVGPRVRWSVPLWALLAAASHSQLLVTALVLGALGMLAAGPWRHRDEARAFVIFGACAGVSLVALYGHGLASFQVPFGFPALEGWRLMGFHPLRFEDFVLEGELLDRDRLPITMAVWTAALVALLARASRGGPRFLLALSVASVVIPFSGYALAASPLFLKAIQAVTPTRFIAFAPLAAGASIALAADGVVPLLARLPRRTGWVAAAGVIAVFVLLAMPRRARAVRLRVATDLAPGCGRPPPDGFDPATLEGWLRPLRGGRLHIDVDGAGTETTCAAMRGAHLTTHAPLDGHAGGPGTQVGITMAAAAALDLRHPDGAARAEALGIRWVLHMTTRAPGPPEAWRVVQQQGSMALSERVGGTDLWGAACVTERWTGDNAALRTALLADIAGRGPALAEPARVVELQVVPGPAPLVVQPVAGTCDASGAHITPAPREPGAYEADVEVPPGAVAVLRATAHPAWSVRVDGGAPLSLDHGVLRIAPGFLAIPLPPGRHHVEAVVRLPRGYVWANVAAIALAVGATLFLRRRAAAA